MDSNFISDPKYSINPPHTVNSHVTEALPVGTRLYNYVITDIIGNGGFGITYRAKEDVSGRVVVIKENFPRHPELKIVYRSPQDGKTVVPYPRYEEFYDWAKNIFAKEAHTLIGLPYHPKIVQVLSVFEANNTAYFVMPFIKGCSLHERYLPPATMPEHELRPFLKDMLEALAHLHAHNVIHRDIKPQNILITPEGKPVLIDFGAARPDNTRKSATQIGTEGYAPPEQMSKKEYDKHPKPHTDLYALGATCYRLITSYEPDYMFDRLAKDPTIKGKYSSELLQSIDKAREKHPEDRWQSAQEWLAALNTTGNKGRKLGMLTSLLLLAIAVPAAYLCYHHQSEPQSPATAPTEQKSATQTSPQVVEQKSTVQYEAIVDEAQQHIKNKQYKGLVDKLHPLAVQGYAPAQSLLGTCYRNGHGVDRDPELAVQWYRKAAEQNYAEAQHLMGLCYQLGVGEEKSPEQAVQWYRKAAEQNHAAAQNNLGVCYLTGIGVKEDTKLGAQWLKKAAEQNVASAQSQLGNCYLYGIGVEKDPKQALQWYQKAAEQNYPHAQAHLGKYYLYGNGEEKDPKLAVQWLQKAAEQNHVNAQLDLAICYVNGVGVEKDLKQAAHWFRKAAEQNNAESQRSLAICYEKGLGIPQDMDLAVYWYRKAADNGEQEAKEALKRLGK